MQMLMKRVLLVLLVSRLAVLCCVSVAAPERDPAAAAPALAPHKEAAAGYKTPILPDTQDTSTSSNTDGTEEAGDSGSSGYSQFAAAAKPARCGTGYKAVGKLCGEPLPRVFVVGKNPSKQSGITA